MHVGAEYEAQLLAYPEVFWIINCPERDEAKSLNAPQASCRESGASCSCSTLPPDSTDPRIVGAFRGSVVTLSSLFSGGTKIELRTVSPYIDLRLTSRSQSPLASQHRRQLQTLLQGTTRRQSHLRIVPKLYSPQGHSSAKKSARHRDIAESRSQSQELR